MSVSVAVAKTRRLLSRANKPVDLRLMLFRGSDHVYIREAEPGLYVGWNRFFPVLSVLNGAVLRVLEEARRGSGPESGADAELDRLLARMEERKFIYRGEIDPSEREFRVLMEAALSASLRQGELFYREKRSYKGITILADDCNLCCSYCVNRYRNPRKTQPAAERELGETLRRVTRDYLERVLKNGEKNVSVAFTGGEILIRFSLIRSLTEWVLANYGGRGLCFDWSINSNMTLMTPDMARFLGENGYRVNVSLDGYEAAHNRTRVYRDGSGSFADVMRGVECWRTYSGSPDPLDSFQGVIGPVEGFEPEKVYDMESYGFRLARLAPNLLEVTEAEAAAKAAIMGRFLELNETRELQVTELFLQNARDRVNSDSYTFLFNCPGLGCYPHMDLAINLSSMRVSQMCAYVPGASLPLEELGYDIYHHRLWDASERFIRGRLDTLRQECFSCPLAGLCAGGCIYTGLDNGNRVNAAACRYQRDLWNIYLHRLVKKRKNKPKG